ncbi:MAG: F0F1 ATP synthase subunit beta, partial [Candidatus Margulisiibacteriota bacterium]
MPGKICQIIGPIVDVLFEEGQLPKLYNALNVKKVGDEDLVLEVMHHLGDNMVRGIAMSSTDGLVRGMEVEDTGAAITVPVGEATLGRIINVTGKVMDYGKPIDTQSFRPIHREPPSFMDQNTKTEVFETGIKVIDLI